MVLAKLYLSLSFLSAIKNPPAIGKMKAKVF
jgi:hypothetical protein